MSKELIVSATRQETRVAVFEDDQVVEIFYQREKEYSLAGSIHKGRVTRVLPGMQSAFVDIGLDRDAFLYVSDFFEDNDEYDKIVTGVEETVLRLDKDETPAPAAVAEPELSLPPAPLVESPAPGTDAVRPPERRDDSHGRRSRRRRSKGRPLPESKFFSPRPRHESPAAGPERAERTERPEQAETRPAEQDFSILPGESLAKYSTPANERQPEPPSDQPTPEMLHLEELAESSVAEAPPSEPEIAEPETAEPETAESSPAEEGAEAAPEEAEQAEVPVSLTATLREQGPRYQHRVSRRMRRKMRGGEPRNPGEERRPAVHDAAVRDAAPPAVAVEPAAEPPADGSRAARPVKAPLPLISDLLREGQEIIVQIAKEPLGQKGARITSHIALPGRFLVYMPTVDHIGISRKISTDEERARLKRILQTHHAGIPGGYIVRTAGEGKSEEDLRADMMFLYNLWMDMRQKAEKRPAPALIHHDLDVVQRILRDQLTSAFKAVWVDNEEIYESVLGFVQRFQPAMVGRVKLYTRRNPIFDEFNVTAELEKALRPKVWLKSGGYIVINQTEALVAIDINTGKYVGRSNRLEDTIVKVNSDAIREIVRQIRLRDLGGIIVVDFIDMEERKNRQKVMQALEEAMRADRAPNKILQFNDFGLVAITRKRVKQSLERTLCAPCPYCEGAGYVKSPQTIAGEILQEAQKIAGAVEGSEVILRVNPEVAKLLKSNRNDYLQEIEGIVGKSVLVKSDPQMHQEKFDLA